jgi:hypothetical protein
MRADHRGGLQLHITAISFLGLPRRHVPAGHMKLLSIVWSRLAMCNPTAPMWRQY